MNRSARWQMLLSMVIFGTIGLFVKYIPLPSAVLALAPKSFWYGQAQKHRDTFGGAATGKVEKPTTNKKPAFEPYHVVINTSRLNIRKGAGTNHKRIGFTGKGVFTIVDEANGTGASKWGLLKSHEDERDGWVSLDYCKKI